MSKQSIAIETDVRMTKDDHMLVCHDKDFKRLGGVDKRVSDLKLSEIPKAYTGSITNFFGCNNYTVKQND